MRSITADLLNWPPSSSALSRILESCLSRRLARSSSAACRRWDASWAVWPLLCVVATGLSSLSEPATEYSISSSATTKPSSDSYPSSSGRATWMSVSADSLSDDPLANSPPPYNVNALSICRRDGGEGLSAQRTCRAPETPAHRALVAHHAVRAPIEHRARAADLVANGTGRAGIWRGAGVANRFSGAGKTPRHRPRHPRIFGSGAPRLTFES